jgi:hypothetical protein
MDHDEAQARMTEIQRIMERATLFTLLPGTPAIVGGLMVLAGCAVSYAMFRSLDFADILKLSFNNQGAFCVMWFAIGVLGVLIEVIITTRAAAKQQLVPRDRPMRIAAFSLTPSVIVAMVLTIKFLIPTQPKAEEIQYIVPIWMMLYGTGVYTAGCSRFSRRGFSAWHSWPRASSPCCGSRNTASSPRPCPSDCSTSFLARTFCGNNGRRWPDERARQTR